MLTRWFESLHQWQRRIGSQYRVLGHRLRGIPIGHGSQIEPGVQIDRGLRFEQLGVLGFGDRVVLSRGAVLHAQGGSVHLGADVFVGPYAMIYGHGGVRIGNDVLIAGHVCIVAVNHSIPDRHLRMRWLPDQVAPIVIGNDVWLGAGATVLAGVKVGDGAVIGAGAVVTRDVPPFAIAVGNPARVIRFRAEGESKTQAAAVARTEVPQS